VTWRKRNIVRNKWTRAKVERATQKVGLFRKNLQTQHEGKSGTVDLGGKRQL
jgi:hypothetical protein